MKKLGFLLLAALASKGALANEVGALFPQLANSTAVSAVAIAETGVSSSLAFLPTNQNTTTQRAANLNDYVENAVNEISSDLKQRILSTLEHHYSMR